MSENNEQPVRPRRFTRPNLTPEQAERRVALAYDKSDTMHWFVGDSGIEVYERILGFNRHELQNKTILDLGTSPSDRLAKDLKKEGVNATVIGLSPDLMNLIPNEIQPPGHMRDEWNRLGVTGIAQAMPFRDASFDKVLGLYSVTWKAADYPEQVKAWVSEIGRVLKPGGDARVGPSYSDRRTAMGDDFANLKEYAKIAGLDIEIQEQCIVLKRPQIVQNQEEQSA